MKTMFSLKEACEHDVKDIPETNRGMNLRRS